MSQVKGIPYGISDFNRMRNKNFYFVDKTMYFPLSRKCPVIFSLFVRDASEKACS